MTSAVRFRFTLLLACSVVAGSLAACRKEGAQQRELVLDEAALRQSLAGLKPRLSALNQKFAVLHKQFDPLPLNLPGFDPLRAKFYNTDEGLGVMGPKIDWLSGRLDAALKAKSRDQLQAVAKDIAVTYDELRLIDDIARELGREVPRFQQAAAEPH